MEPTVNSHLLAPRAKLLRTQRRLFQELLRHVWKHSAFYRDYYQSHGLREQELADVTVRDLPFLSKKIVMENFDCVVTDACLRRRELEQWLDEVRDPKQRFRSDFIVMHSSGSSGTTGIFVYRRTDWQVMNSIMAARLPPPENHSGKARVAFYRASHGHFAGVATAVHMSKSVYDTLIVSVMDPLERVIDQLQRFQPHRLTGYSSSIAPLAEAALEGKLRIHPQTIFVSGDILLPSAERKIREAWGVPIYNLYGASESLFLGVQETGQQEMALMDDLNIFEFLDAENRPVQSGQEGRVAITNLYNHTLPILRYELGDHVTQGATDPAFGFSTILGIRPGKENERLPVILDNGERDAFNPRVLTSFYAPGLQRAQFVVNRSGRIHIDYIASENIDDEIRKEFQRILDFKGASRMPFEVRQVPSIAADPVTGKVRLVVTAKEGNAGEAVPIRLSTASAEKSQNRLSPAKHLFTPFDKTEIEQSISNRFESQVQKYSERIAVKIGKHALTYETLNRAANRVAQAILSAQGEKDEPIAVLLEQGIQAVVAILGVLKAGKFYVPLEPAYPEARLAAMAEDSQAVLILTNNANLPLASAILLNARVLNIDSLEPGGSDQNPGLSICPDTLAYLFYTSGSTGRPKGVSQTHRNVLHQIMTYTNGLQLCCDDHVTLLHSYGFSASRLDIFGALLNGAALFPFSVAEAGLGNLARWLAEEEISLCHWVPTAFRNFAETLGAAHKFPSVRLLVLGSEPLLSRDVELYRKHFAETSVLVNRFGTTETGNVRWYFIDKSTNIPGNVVPVGYPIEDIEVLILDEAGREVGHSQTGEIAIKSCYLSPGYWRQPELTGEVFSQDGAEGARIYRTGDVGRMLPDGCLLHLGRKDFQVKIRGHRIELGDIERVLLEHGAVKETVVVAREELAQDKRLVAYIVAGENPAPTSSELRSFLEARLPGYMVPAAFAQLEVLPRTSNGKVDRQSLPEPAGLRPDAKRPLAGPRNATEKVLVEIWSRLLQHDRVGIHDDFFDLGGHSLLAIRIISQVINTFNVEVPLRSFFDLPTVAHLANIISQSQEKAGGQDLADMLADLESLSEVEAVKLLERDREERPQAD